MPYVPPTEIVVTLRQPITHDDRTYTDLTLRRPTSAALQITCAPVFTRLSKAGRTELQIRMIALYARIPIGAVDLLAVGDAKFVFREAGKFWGPADLDPAPYSKRQRKEYPGG